MARQASQRSYFLPFMLADLAINACDTIASRTLLIATGQCTAAEYRRMVMEKAEAAQASFLAVAGATPAGALEAAMMPWLNSARANAERLRRKR
jgi:hypothetical protein